MGVIRNVQNNKAHNGISSRYWRIYVLALFVFLGAFLIISRLYFLQVLASERFKALADNQHKAVSEIEANRGEVFLKEKEDIYPLAINKQLQTVYVVPKEILNEDDVIKKIMPILGLNEDVLKSKFSDKNDPFEIVKKKLSNEEADQIKNLKIKGVYFLPEMYRYYPSGELASQVVGFLGSDGEKIRGVYGLESFWEKELKGEAGILKQERDSGGRWISVSDRDLKPAKNGANLILTIDHTVQYEVEKILKKTVEKHTADNGTILVMEPATGKILAMANYPNFNPNDYSKIEDISLFNNPAINMAYEPGSIFKPITIAVGIDDGKISPSTEYIDTGFVLEAGYKLKNSEEKVYGKQTMTQVLEESINTGVIFTEKLIGNEKFLQYIKNFGFGEKTDIDLPAEVTGNISNLEKTKRDINFFTASFGQGISVTPIQLTSAFAAIANGGTLMKPQIVDRIIYDQEGADIIAPQPIRKVISQETSKLLGGMLRSVVLNGHGKRADVPGYLVGGKTGTAQVAKVGSGGYQDNLTIGSFIGYAPLNDPRFVVLVKISNPKDVQWAESTAAPAFGEVMKFLLEYYRVEPTEDLKISPMYKSLYQDVAPPPQSIEKEAVLGVENEKKETKDKKKKN